ncbi:hypothetical protein GCM10009634_46280 [Saccharothrix xinjiangensis]
MKPREWGYGGGTVVAVAMEEGAGRQADPDPGRAKRAGPGRLSRVGPAR